MHIIYDATGNHCFGTTYTFFAWLKNNFDSTAHFIFMLRNQFGNRKTYSYVAVMAAGMHQSLMQRAEVLYYRPMCFSGCFVNFIGIHIKTQPNNISRFSKLHDANNACFAAAHFFYPFRLCALFQSSFHCFFKDSFVRNTHHSFFFDNLCSAQNLIS